MQNSHIAKFIAAALLVTSLSACGVNQRERTLSGGAIGAGVGAVGGAIISSNPIAGALVGGAVGAVTGAATNPNQINLDNK